MFWACSVEFAEFPRGQYLAGFEARDFSGEAVGARDGLHGELAPAEVQGRHAIAHLTGVAAGRDADQEAVAGLFEQGLFGEGARCDDALHPAFHRALAPGRVADLFADGDRDAEVHELREIAVYGMVGHSGHGNGCSGGLAAGGEGDVEQFRSALRIVVEEFVEISHAVEKQVVGVLRLDAQVLLHHGRVLGTGHAGGFSTNPVRRSRVVPCEMAEIAESGVSGYCYYY